MPIQCSDSGTMCYLTLEERLASVALKGPLLKCCAWKKSHEVKVHENLIIEGIDHTHLHNA